MSLTKEEYDEIYLRALGNARPRVKSKPVLATNKGKELEHTKPADVKPTEAVIDAATAHNNALTERLDTMEGRRQARIAKELADYHAEGSHWHALCQWQRSVLDAQERKQVSEGFISRHQIFNAGRGTVRRVKIERARGACPSWLAQALRRVAGSPALIDNRAQYFERKDGTKELIKGGLRQIGFGEGAEDRWYDYDYEIRSIEDDDKIEVWIRAAEIALRDATIVAAYHTGEIDLEVLDWAIALVKHSMTQLEQDLKKYMSEDLGMADACDLLREQFVRRINHGKPRVMTIGDIRKFLERKIDPQKIMGVVYQLQTCGDIRELDEAEGPGRPTKRYTWMKGTAK